MVVDCSALFGLYMLLQAAGGCQGLGPSIKGHTPAWFDAPHSMEAAYLLQGLWLVALVVTMTHASSPL